MSSFSKLFNISKNILKPNVLFNKSLNQITIQSTRDSHGRTMFIRPGKFYTKKYFDILVSRN